MSRLALISDDKNMADCRIYSRKAWCYPPRPLRQIGKAWNFRFIAAFWLLTSHACVPISVSCSHQDWIFLSAPLFRSRTMQKSNRCKWYLTLSKICRAPRYGHIIHSQHCSTKSANESLAKQHWVHVSQLCLELGSWNFKDPLQGSTTFITSQSWLIKNNYMIAVLAKCNSMHGIGSLNSSKEYSQFIVLYTHVSGTWLDVKLLLQCSRLTVWKRSSIIHQDASQAEMSLLSPDCIQTPQQHRH